MKEDQAFTEDRLSLEEKAKRVIIKTLEKYGCKILRSDIPKAFSLTTLKAEDKPKLAKFLGTKYDLFVSRPDTKEHYLAEVKGKSLDRFKTIVNQVEYNGYWEIARLPFPFLYFVWIEENGKIYRHEITNPEGFRKDYDNQGKPIYYIPESKLHEIKPSWAKAIIMFIKP